MSNGKARTLIPGGPFLTAHPGAHESGIGVVSSLGSLVAWSLKLET